MKKVEIVAEVRLSGKKYEDYMKSPWPLDKLTSENTWAFKLIVTSKRHKLKEARNFNEKKYYKARIMEVTRKVYEEQQVDEGTIFLLKNSRGNEKTALNMKLEKHIEKFKKATPEKIDLEEPFSIESLDAVVRAAGSQPPQYYIHNVNYERKMHRDKEIFHNPATVNSPLLFARVNAKQQALKEEINTCWTFFGPTLSSTYVHFDECDTSVINTMLNSGMKLWILIDPRDANELVKKLKELAGYRDNCPASYGLCLYLIPPSVLNSWGIRFRVTIQRRHETIILAPNVMHMVINLSYSVNIVAAFLDRKGCLAKPTICTCDRHNDWRDVTSPAEVLKMWDESRKMSIIPSKPREKRLQCLESNCGRKFEQQKQLTQHMKIHGVRPHKCHDCAATFAQRCHLRTHLMNKHGKPIRCGLKKKGIACRWKTKDLREMDYHKMLEHEMVRFPCKFCGKIFKRKKTLEAHEKNHHPRDPMSK